VADRAPGPAVSGPPGPAPGAAKPRVREIVAAARAVLVAEGVDALTMRRLATELGIQAPSLYKHLPGKHAVEDALIAMAFTEIGEALHAALDRTRHHDRVGALLREYRRVARREPNLYRLATGRPLRRESLPEGLEEWAGRPFFLATSEPQLAQALWSYAHGMVILELDGRYPPGSDLDATWAAGAAAFQAAADSVSAPERPVRRSRGTARSR
jgi:AcrR family transcriptional regulator